LTVVELLIVTAEQLGHEVRRNQNIAIQVAVNIDSADKRLVGGDT